jgi:hypothetical protein
MKKLGLGTYIRPTSNTNDRLSPICRWRNRDGMIPGVDVMITIFCDFCLFLAKKIAFPSKTNVMIKFFGMIFLCFECIRQFFSPKNSENILKVTTSVPVLLSLISIHFCVPPSSRVIRLVEFSRNGRSFTLGRSMLNFTFSYCFGLLFNPLKLIYKFWQKWIGQHFGRFFITNSSGHPAINSGCS